ncbi:MULTISPECIES: isocitrate lyase/PEP mutase family protein [unclassified Solwaraspora]|uniref:isocitrate lyase/PEP mutase family protein n=1 Tax=unclassified Solwaraspora TaxID=2627926 RepID=UPI00259AF703|nr:isocitrate lyase/phosphoenolpyruvate mutase family protein [Solwaraspora sp. WMMA2056]WJK43539.1 isocitrate lyase/phosphoenolpyruvate mutase family protein [Solwaraspora sp. WMMA2056]
MVDSTQQGRAESLRSMHSGGILVLPNAWDAGSAAAIAAAGARAIATTSGGVAWSVGRTDGHGMSRQEMVDQIRWIADAVDVPVTADIEGGYGPTPGDVADTVEAAVAAGAVGVNIEDSRAPGGPLFDLAEQADRVRAARDGATRAGLPGLVINIRTDVFLFGIGEPDGRLADVIERAEAYAQAGADCLFVPGLTDLATLATLTASVPLPVNVMAGPGAPTVAEFEAAGVRRVSLGTAVSQAAYAVAQRAAIEALTKGTYDELDGGLDYGTLNGYFTR